MRVFRAGGITSENFAIPLTRGGAQQAVVILDARDDFVRQGDSDRLDSVTLYRVNGALLPPDDSSQWADIALLHGREIGVVHTDAGQLVRTVILDFDPEPGEVLVADLDSGFTDERSSWKLRILLDGLGTIPLIISPSNTGELIEGEGEDGSFISDIALDIHHIDAELEAETRGIQTVGVTAQFDGETGYLILTSGQLLDKNMTTGETHLLARITEYVEFPVTVNYFPDANIEADFRREIAGLALDLTDMALTAQGAVFGFETFMPAELGGFFLTRGAFNAPDGEMLITRTGIAGAAEFSAADSTNSRLFDRFNADLSEIEVTYDEAAETLILAPVVTLRDFIAQGVHVPLHFSEGGGFVVEDGAGRLEGGLSAFGSYRIVTTEGVDPFRVTLEALTLDLSDPTVVNLRTGIALDIGFGRDLHLPAIEALVGLTEDFTLDELVLDLPELLNFPLAPPLFFMTAAKLGLHGPAPGGVAARAAFEADISILPDLPLPGGLEGVADLGQITINGQIGLDGFQGGGHLTLGTVLGGSLFELDTALVIDAASHTLTATATTTLGLPILGGGIVNSFLFSAGLDGTAEVISSITLGLPSNIAWLLSLAGLPDPGAVTFTMTGNMTPQGTLADQYLAGTVDLGVAGFEVRLGAKLSMDGSLQFFGYDLSEAPDFVEAPPSGPAGTARQGVEVREGQDLAMRTTGDTANIALIGPGGTARSLAELEADDTDNITIHRDAGGVSVFIADAAAGRWAIEAATDNGFLAMAEQQALQLTTRLLGAGATRRLEVTADAPGGGDIRLEVYRDGDAMGFDGPLASLALTQDGFAEFCLAELGLPVGEWNLHVRAVAEGHVEARQYLPAPLLITPADLPDRGILGMRWVPIDGLGDGETPRYALEITLREHGRVAEVGLAAQLVINGAVVEGFNLPRLDARQTLTYLHFAEPGESIAAPPRGEELRATLTLLSEGHETSLANNMASAALYTTPDGVTSPLLLGTPDADLLRGTTLAERLQGLGGDDRLMGGGFGDTLQGGKGSDRYWLASNDDIVVERADEGMDLVHSPSDITLGTHVEHLVLRGNGDIHGFGNDLANRLTGNAGDNHLRGQAGRDTLLGGLGADRMEGGAGDDIYRVDDAGDVTTELPGGGHDQVLASVDWTLGAEVERLALSGSADLNGSGNALANRIDGNAGANILAGGDGNDALRGAAGADTLLGGAGEDMLDGGEGADRLEGGAGGDRFLFRSATKAAGDVIVDFSVAEGDRIDLRPIDANKILAGNQAFSWIGGAAFSGAAGQLRLADGALQGDLDGDALADFLLQFQGVGSLSPGSMWL